MGKERLTAEGTGFFESLFDSSFRESITTNNQKLLYGLHPLAGLIAAVVCVVQGFQISPTQGLINLLASLVAYFFWILYDRIVLEFLLAVFPIGEAAAPSTNAHAER